MRRRSRGPAARAASRHGADGGLPRRPQLHDPPNEKVLDAAVNGAADALAAFNRQDFGHAPARFGVALLSPQEALRRLPP